MDVAELIGKYGFPIVASVGMGYLIYYVWEWATKEVKPVLSEANTVLIALIDRIRMLDNDLIRLNQKLNVILQLRSKEIAYERDSWENRPHPKDRKKSEDENSAASGES